MQNKNKIFKKISMWIVIVTIAFGWKYPLLGFSVPVVMLIGMIGGLIASRYVCGNICPRGAFIDVVFPYLSMGKKIPKFFRNMKFRWSLFALMMSFMLLRVLQNPSSLDHWGRVFWLMCFVTTVIAFVLSFFYSPRVWCALCPMGTVQAALGGKKKRVLLADSCVSCSLCHQACPMGIDIVTYKDKGFIDDPDCIKCRACVYKCKLNSLK